MNEEKSPTGAGTPLLAATKERHRGYMDVSAMAHFYRGELSRLVAYRTRMDMTTSWSITSTGALLAVGLANDKIPEAFFIVNLFLVIVFWLFEVRLSTIFSAFLFPRSCTSC